MEDFGNPLKDLFPQLDDTWEGGDVNVRPGSLGTRTSDMWTLEDYEGDAELADDGEAGPVSVDLVQGNDNATGSSHNQAGSSSPFSPVEGKSIAGDTASVAGVEAAPPTHPATPAQPTVPLDVGATNEKGVAQHASSMPSAEASEASGVDTTDRSSASSVDENDGSVVPQPTGFADDILERFFPKIPSSLYARLRAAQQGHLDPSDLRLFSPDYIPRTEQHPQAADSVMSIAATEEAKLFFSDPSIFALAWGRYSIFKSTAESAGGDAGRGLAIGFACTEYGAKVVALGGGDDTSKWRKAFSVHLETHDKLNRLASDGRFDPVAWTNVKLSLPSSACKWDKRKSNRLQLKEEARRKAETEAASSLTAAKKARKTKASE